MDGSRTLSMQDLPPELQPYMFPETLYRVLPKILHSALSALGERGESSFDAEEDDVRGVFYFSSLEPQRVKRHVSREIADLRARIGRRDCFVLLSSDCRRFRDGVPFVWTQWRCQDISSDYSVDFCLTFVAFSTHDDDPLQEEVPIPDDLRPFSKAETLLPSLPKFLSDFADSIEKGVEFTVSEKVRCKFSSEDNSDLDRILFRLSGRGAEGKVVLLRSRAALTDFDGVVVVTQLKVFPDEIRFSLTFRVVALPS